MQATCAAVSPNGQFIACGSNTGIVNVYEMHSAFGKSKKEEGVSVSGEPTWSGGAGESPKPLYSLPNLTTSALFLRFNPDAQMMAFGSSVKVQRQYLSQDHFTNRSHFSSWLVECCTAGVGTYSRTFRRDRRCSRRRGSSVPSSRPTVPSSQWGWRPEGLGSIGYTTSRDIRRFGCYVVGA